MNNIIGGLLLSLQLLTTLPIRKTVQWNKHSARWSVRFFPLVGGLLGGLLAAQYWLFAHYTSVSALFLSLWLLFFPVLFSGGLHLDGWMDCSDAFFSYRDQKRRQEIMSDSRVGAFAVISVIFLLSFRFLFIYETIMSGMELTFLLLIPFLSRSFMSLLLIQGRLAKPNGMAAAFREHVNTVDGWIIAAVLLVIPFCLIVFDIDQLFSISLLVVSAFICLIWSQSFYKKQFGGITGDTLGAFVEGVETWLWFTIWLLRCFGTV
ncbi:cobalamin-5'-phosphate synthase [Anoxybacillus vitaminiphilus]|uniref:Adenosylcobinamide-GDP ribazoletransferase n=1 Tax=Paranoxybacillus vitaminiphilus TaxID=581036 RepID=A0A327YNZ6_9BACL|nr:adenosylcobinamide-GDP ribazoletransferase [Anoxybacillus vitaminiphilus]RAK22211.1 cobalamin-5'-phosphate synthase [Anoxybacillus vitaminiphilus]